MDIGSVIGLVVALVLIVSGMGAFVTAFIDLPSLLIVVGGTLGATMVFFPLENHRRRQRNFCAGRMPKKKVDRRRKRQQAEQSARHTRLLHRQCQKNLKSVGKYCYLYAQGEFDSLCPNIA